VPPPTRRSVPNQTAPVSSACPLWRPAARCPGTGRAPPPHPTSTVSSPSPWRRLRPDECRRRRVRVDDDRHRRPGGEVYTSVSAPIIAPVPATGPGSYRSRYWSPASTSSNSSSPRGHPPGCHPGGTQPVPTPRADERTGHTPPPTKPHRQRSPGASSFFWDGRSGRTRPDLAIPPLAISAVSTTAPTTARSAHTGLAAGRGPGTTSDRSRRLRPGPGPQPPSFASKCCRTCTQRAESGDPTEGRHWSRKPRDPPPSPCPCTATA
jgi:hypothetical protein